MQLKMSPNLPFFLLLIILSVSFSSACNADDEKALLAFKNSFTTDSFPSWTPTTDCCTWDYIDCDDNGRLNAIAIDVNHNLSGRIPPTIGNFPTLQVLGISDVPYLVGPIPPQISNLKNLTAFSLSNTNVSGPIPSSLSQLTQLSDLFLSVNKLSGPIPPSLAQLSNLNTIDLSSNRLTGPIPAGLFGGSQSFGLNINLNNNKLTGEIPRSFGEGLNLFRIDFSSNRLTGDSSHLLAKGKVMLLANNRLSFNLTNAVFPKYTQGDNQYSLDISHNRIYGSLTEGLVAANVLTLDVSYNFLCGEIPSGLRKFKNKSFEHNKCLCGKPLAACLLATGILSANKSLCKLW